MACEQQPGSSKRKSTSSEGHPGVPSEQCSEENYSESNSYDDFRSVMANICERYAPLNPCKGELYKHLKSEERPDGFTLNETGMEFIRGGIVATVAAWESYVQDVFMEAFEILIKLGSGKPQSIETLKIQWPGCEAALKKGKKIKMASQL